MEMVRPDMGGMYSSDSMSTCRFMFLEDDGVDFLDVIVELVEVKR